VNESKGRFFRAGAVEWTIAAWMAAWLGVMLVFPVVQCLALVAMALGIGVYAGRRYFPERR